ncbi:MAG: sensor histidine kinase [Gammaproteobacteria bacterium]|nr:sensor histidine kinase [Gammaproteobacteria bacterium]
MEDRCSSQIVTFYRPRSILALILTGFAFVSLPFIVALIIAESYVDRLARQSEQAVEQTAQVTSNSRMLAEQAVAMERSARQFLVLEDPELLTVYTKTHQEFLKTASTLYSLPLDQKQKQKLVDAEKQAGVLFHKMGSFSGKSDESGQVVAEFLSLSDLAKEIFADSNQLINRKMAVLQNTAWEAQQMLLWLGAALVPLAMVLIATFASLIARPISHIDQAIRRLGDGEFSTAISVDGPRDLEALGQRLDWLRLRLIELEEEKNKFLRNISHDLKTPLAAIREGSELLTEEAVGKLTDEQRDIARILRQNGVQLQVLIEDLLNFNIASMRGTHVEFSPVKLDDLIDKVIEDHRAALIAKNIFLDKHCAPLTVAGDREKLRVVVDNLLSNAVKYTPAKGTITLSLASATKTVTSASADSGEETQEKIDRVVLDVTDTGPGIDPGDKNKIFDIFYRGNVPQHGHIKGTGLGLAIAKEFVSAHGGTIEVVENQKDGSGAHFRVMLPVGRPNEE